jgi:hypothetical protein
MDRSINAKCGACGHVWRVCDLPQPLTKAARLMKAARCPKGCASQVFLARTTKTEGGANG